MKILVAMPAGAVRDTFIPEETAGMLEKLGTVEWNGSSGQFTEDELREKIKDADVCITGWGNLRFDSNILENARNLKLVAHTGGTVAPIVSDCLYDRGIKVVSGNSIFAESVAESVIAYILASLRDIPYYNNEMQEGRWKPNNYYNEGLLDQTVGLVDFGAVARFVVGMLKPFRARIKVCSGYIGDETLAEYGMERATLEEIFTTCKIISIHSAKRPDTWHMVNAELLKMIPEGALLVNTARGSIIDEAALAEELQKGRFKAVLDVYETEPLPPESKLRKLKNVILIPHMGGPTIDRRKYVTLGLIEDIKRFSKGEKLKYEISREHAAAMTR